MKTPPESALRGSGKAIFRIFERHRKTSSEHSPPPSHTRAPLLDQRSSSRSMEKLRSSIVVGWWSCNGRRGGQVKIKQEESGTRDRAIAFATAQRRCTTSLVHQPGSASASVRAGEQEQSRGFPKQKIWFYFFSDEPRMRIAWRHVELQRG